MKNNPINGVNGQSVSAVSRCNCSTKHVYVPYMSHDGTGDVDIQEIDQTCSACREEMVKDYGTTEENLNLLDDNMAFRYLHKKYSIKCSYAEDISDDLPF